MTVLADYERALRRRNFSRATLKRRMGVLRSLQAWMEPDSILDATDATIEVFLDSRRRAGPRTRHHYLSDIRCFFRWAQEQERTDHNPTVTVIEPKLPRLLPRPISESDLEVAINAAHREMRAWLALAAYAGLRCMEIAGLNAEDILWHEDRGTLRVFGKGSKERMVPMHDLVIVTLVEWGVPRKGPVFTRPRGGRWPAEVLSNEGNAFLAGLGIDATMHSLRHRFGTMTYDLCRDIRVVQELMGHADPKTTAGYTAHSQAQAREAVKSLPAHIGASDAADDDERTVRAGDVRSDTRTV